MSDHRERDNSQESQINRLTFLCKAPEHLREQEIANEHFNRVIIDACKLNCSVNIVTSSRT